MLGDPVSEQVIGCACKVANTLGPGFLEKAYENALLRKLQKTGLKAQAQKGLAVWYDDVLVGEFAADLLIEARILVELEACLLLNFGTPRIEVRRLGQNKPPSHH